jgi:hypothetical protein
VVELTEQTPIDSYVELEPDLNQLRAAGALIAIDDAGAGYAGLRHLLALRPSLIKIDRELIQDVDRDEAKRALISMLGTFASRVDAPPRPSRLRLSRAIQHCRRSCCSVTISGRFPCWTRIPPDSAW